MRRRSWLSPSCTRTPKIGDDQTVTIKIRFRNCVTRFLRVMARRSRCDECDQNGHADEEAVRGRRSLCVYVRQRGYIAERQARFGLRIAGFCISSLEPRKGANTGYCGNEVSLLRDDTSPEFGFGPAWIRPSCRIESSENGDMATRSSKDLSFG